MEACLRQSPSNLKEVLSVGKDIFWPLSHLTLLLSFNCFHKLRCGEKEVQFNISEFYQVSGGSWERDP